MPLTDNDRRRIRDSLVANCGCQVPEEAPWKHMSSEQINNLDDEQLSVLDRWNKSILRVREGGFSPNNDVSNGRHVWNSKLNRWETEPPPHQPGSQGQTQNATPPGTGTPPSNPPPTPPPGSPPPPPPKPKSLTEALEMFGSPEEKAAWNAVLESQNRERMSIIEDLMQDLTDEGQRTEVFNYLNSLSVNHLQSIKIVKGSGQPRHQEQPALNFFGATGAPPSSAPVTQEEPLVCPVYSFGKGA